MNTFSYLAYVALPLFLAAQAAGEEFVDFRNDLIPVLTKHGCNAGACHGAAIGRGGFKLSLYGGNPKADYEAIVQQVGGRRVNLFRPEESLILLKPTQTVEHGGGTIFAGESPGAQLLLDWIGQGAPHDSSRVLTRLEVAPRRHVAKALGEPVSLRATAFYSDGSKRDVTKWTVFTAEDSSAVKIDAEAAQAKLLRRGRHIVVARHLSEVLPVELIVPLSESTIDLTDQRRCNFIDEEILESLETLGLQPSPTIDDGTFLRRITLDLTGRLPSPQRVSSFLADKDANKRQNLIDELLKSDEFTEYWTLQLAKLLRIRPPGGDRRAAQTYHTWLAGMIRRDASYQQLARALMTATGDTHENGPANFYRTTRGPREQAEFVSESLMGSRLRCANCHNHPLDRWTQDDYHGLAAIFAKVENDQIVQVNPQGVVVHPRTLQPAIARIPGEQFLSQDDDPRRQLADWLTDSQNPYFAKAIVNRLWKRMMGRGLVEPTDDFRATNPATHPALLDKLADDFRANGYSLRHTLGVIAQSTTYARSTNTTEQNQHDDRFYSHALRRPLEAEVLADAISDVLGVASKYGDQPQGTRAVALVNPRTPSRTLEVLGRCARDDSCESSPQAAGGLSQKLHLFNGPLLNARIAAEGSRLRRLLDAQRKPIEIIQEFYLVALGRHPTGSEKQHWQQQLASASDSSDFLEDFIWGLLMSQEFATNH